MQCEVKDEDGYSIVQLSGEVDLATSPRARKAILDCIGKNNGCFIDLSGVSYIDSSGVASLVEGYQQAKSKKIRFGLVGVSEAATNVLQLARLDKVFPIFKTLDDCLAADS